MTSIAKKNQIDWKKIGDQAKPYILPAISVFIALKFGKQILKGVTNVVAPERDYGVVSSTTGDPVENVPPPPGADQTSWKKAQSVALRQFAAMDRFGTDETTLFNSLMGLSGKELDLVFKAFGQVKYFGVLGQGSAWFATPRDLFGWYDGELGRKDRQKMVQIWAKAPVHKYTG